MASRSPIEDYYLCRRGIGGNPIDENVSNAELQELLVRMRNEQQCHLIEQDELLTIIRNQSRPQFIREVGANVVGSFIYDGLRYFLRCFKP